MLDPMAQDLSLLHAMWERQEAFQRKVFPTWDSLSAAERAAATRSLAIHAVSEISEVLRETEWKLHRHEVPVLRSRSNMLEELTDLFKYWMALTQLHNFTPADVVEEFCRKSRVVEQRWYQEQELQLDPTEMVVVDVDNTLADYWGGFLAFLHRETGICVDRAKIASTDLYAEVARLMPASMSDVAKLKHQFRESGAKRDLPVLDGASALMTAINMRHGQTVILTARPYEQYKRVFADTIEWLDTNRLSYSAIWMAEDKREFLLRAAPRVSMVVNDDPGECVRLADAGYLVKMIAWPYNAHVQPHPNIERTTQADLAEHIALIGLP